MDTILKFKTTIKCGGCLEKVTPFLDKKAGQHNWSVDLQSPERILTVQPGKLSEKEIISTVEEAGFRAEPLLHN
ncbi:MAG: heavy-metal-associated domain-containing protein [Chitinophagaceae bacterium]